MRTFAVLPLAAAVQGAFLEPPTMAYGMTRAARASSPAMIIDQMKAAAKELEGQAAEAIVAKKVADKLEKAQEKYDIPSKYIDVMGGFFTSYMTNVYKAGNDVDYYEKVLTQLFQKVLETAQTPYKFAPFHKSMREPFDYYALGCEFATGVINRETSEIVGIEQIEKIKQQVAAGDNVVLFANHQSEADPQIFSVLPDPEYPGFAESTIFVAGDRVTTDLLAQPFSMGRNLLCIYSKKHIANPPELKSEKTRHNRNVMKEMQNLFKEGGQIIWVAPSGGRDRKDETGDFAVAPFDSKSIEMFRLMADKAGRTTHFYPLSMLTYNVCPPPDAVGGAVGEQRTVNWSPAGLHFGEAVNLDEFIEACVVENFPADCDPSVSRDAARESLSAHIHSVVSTNYASLAQKLDGKL